LAYIGLILLQKLTFWRPARVAREARGFSTPRPQIVVQFGAITLSTSPISMVLCCDPLAIALTAAASARRSTAA